MFIKKMIFGAALCFAAASSSWAASTLLVNSFLPPGHPINTKLLKPWAKDVYKATEGRVRIHIAPQSLAAPAAQMDAVVNGVADAAYMFNGFLTSTVKLDASARTKLAGNGVKFEKASPQFTADLHALGDPMVQKWLADAKAMGVDGKAAIAYYKTQQDLVNGKK